jgi:hypothetical protein
VPRLATLDPRPMGEKARIPTAKTRNIEKTDNLLFHFPTSFDEMFCLLAHPLGTLGPMN